MNKMYFLKTKIIIESQYYPTVRTDTMKNKLFIKIIEWKI